MPPGSRVDQEERRALAERQAGAVAAARLVTPSQTAESAAKPFAVRPHSESAPPAITASQTPSATSLRADASARAPDEHAVESV